MPIPGPSDAIAKIEITLYGSGQMSIGGNVGDKKLACDMLRHALDAVKNQLRPEDERRILIPGKDVDLQQHPNYPTVAAGDMRS